MKKLIVEQRNDAIWFFTKGGLYLPPHILERIIDWLNENTEGYKPPRKKIDPNDYLGAGAIADAYDYGRD